MRRDQERIASVARSAARNALQSVLWIRHQELRPCPKLISGTADAPLSKLNTRVRSVDFGKQGNRFHWHRLLDIVFGYDFFISYSWSDGAAYAAALARRLEKEGFAVFLDRANYAAGDDWKKVGGWTLKRTGQLILVGSPASTRSAAVIREVQIFSQTRRRIVPIDFAGSTEWKEPDAPLARYFPPEILRVRETAEALQSGPSDQTVTTIRQTFNLVTQHNKRLRWLAVIAIVLGILAATAISASILFFVEKSQALRNESASLAAVSDIALKEGQPVDAVELALAAWPRKGDDERPQMKRVIGSLVAALSMHHERLRLVGHIDSVRSAALSPDGKRIVTASRDKTARIWDAGTGALLTTLRHKDAVTFAAFDPSEDRVVTASVDKIARIWDAATGTLLQALEGHDEWVNFAGFSPDGKRIATASDDSTVRIWDAITGESLRTLEGHRGPVQWAAFSPDGFRIVTASKDMTARIWNVDTGALVKTLEGHGDFVRSAVFSPDGTRIVTASGDYTARIWDTQTGRSLTVLRGHGSGVNIALFSPDGRRIATGSGDKTVRLWDAQTGELLAVLSGHDDCVEDLALSPDGTRLASSSDDHTVRIWSNFAFNAGDVFVIACASLGNDTNLAGLAQRYGITELKPICGNNWPKKIDLNEQLN
jgi:WD40 repeat protein